MQKDTQTAGVTEDRSLLMTLPPELRNYIYSIVFQRTICSIQPQTESWESPRYIKAPGTILACKQCHEESIGLFYQDTIFESVDKLTLNRWLRAIPEPHSLLIQTARAVLETSNRLCDLCPGTMAEEVDGKLRRLRRALYKGDGNSLLSPNALQTSVWILPDVQVWTSTPLATYEAMQ